MKIIETQFGVSSEADFEKNTWTFQMPDNYRVAAGQFALVDKPFYDELIKRQKFSYEHMKACWDASFEWHYNNAYGPVPNPRPDFETFMKNISKIV